jgi:peptide-methionine (S)-S-oxide reductase
VDALCGYAGGHTENPTYEEVCRGQTGHAEVVEVAFDPAVISYAELVLAFLNLHDPTTKDRQGPDIGDQYRSIVIAQNDQQAEIATAEIRKADNSGIFGAPIVTDVVHYQPFYRAEEYHQRYLAKRGRF